MRKFLAVASVILASAAAASPAAPQGMQDVSQTQTSPATPLAADKATNAWFAHAIDHILGGAGDGSSKGRPSEGGGNR